MVYQRVFQFLSAYTDNNKIILVLVAVVIVSLIVDTSVVKIYYFSFNQSPTNWRIIMFIFICSVSIGGLYILSEFAKHRSTEIRTRQALRMYVIHKMVMISIYTSVAIIVLIVFQLVLLSHYYVVLLTAAIWVAYTTTIALTGILAHRFFSWFKSNKNSVVLLYGLASATLSLNAAFTVGFVTPLLMDLPVYSQARIGFGSPFFTMGAATNILNYGYVASSILSFILWWVAAAFVLRHYSGNSRTKTYWIILIIPLIYFLIQFQPLFLSLFSTNLTSEPLLFSVVYTLIFTLSKPVGGILFGLAFWSITRKLGSTNAVRNYMIVSAYGLMLVFVSNQAGVLVSAPYPPFGLATISFMGLSSYLLLVGIYSSAISMAQDVRLRTSVRQLAVNLLADIGLAHMEQEIEKRVLTVVERASDLMEKETGVEPSLDEADVKDYLRTVLEELKNKQAGISGT